MLPDHQQMPPDSDNMHNLLSVPYNLRRRDSVQSTESAASTEASDTSSAETDLSGETLFSPWPETSTPTPPPTEHQESRQRRPRKLAIGKKNQQPPKILPPLRETVTETETEAEAEAETDVAAPSPAGEAETKPAENLGERPLSFVDAHRLKLPREGSPEEAKSWGVWEYWRGRDSGVGVK